LRSGGNAAPGHSVVAGVWPDVRLSADAPLSAYAGLAVARRLAATMTQGDVTANALAHGAGLTPPTVRARSWQAR